ncbi:MAG: hypothetical protein GEU79_17325 [Acidimicrobiia bacterium]|nr:hypothetical protein [Acidimicrobiia bacterium]
MEARIMRWNRLGVFGVVTALAVLMTSVGLAAADGQVEVDPDTLEFDVLLGETSTQPLTITNDGTEVRTYYLSDHDGIIDPSFTGVGDLPQDTMFASRIRGFSGDGSNAVGRSSSGPWEAMRWQNGEMIGLGDLPGGGEQSESNDASYDGDVVVGYATTDETGTAAFRWEDGTMTPLGNLGGTPLQSFANGVSHDGSVVVGATSSPDGLQAFRWESGTMTALGDLEGGSVSSTANAVSADGTVVAGRGAAADGSMAFRWENGTFEAGDLPGGSTFADAQGISANGEVVVGYSSGENGIEAFRWEDGTITGLGNFPGEDGISFARDASGDGSVIVGYGTADVRRAAIWTEGEGMRQVQTMLTEDLGLDLTGWTLVEVNGVSDDGAVITGSGRSVNGNEGWVATIGDVDAPWLTVEPEVTVQPGSDIDIDVTVDPAGLVPGVYEGEIRITSVDGTTSVPVTATVTAPDDWGSVVGTVESLERCDTPGQPLPEASVTIGDRTIPTDEAGDFVMWLPAGEYTHTAEFEGFQTDSQQVEVDGGGEIVVDSALRPHLPCASHSPGSLSFEVEPGAGSSENLTLSNDGAAELDYTVVEHPSGPDTEPAKLAPADEESRPESLPGWEAPSDSASLQGRTLDEATQSPSNAPGAWDDSETPVPGGTVRSLVVTCPGDTTGFYKLTGFDTSATLSAQVFHYDTGGDGWTELAPMPGGRERPSGVCTEDGRIHVIGGLVGQNPTNSHYVYDIATDTWLEAAAPPRNVWAAAAGVWDGKLYLAGGSSSNSTTVGNTAEVNVYDIAADNWVEDTDPMPAPNNLMGYAQFGKYLYVVGGQGDDFPENQTTTLRLDMETGTWESGPEFTSARADIAFVATDSALYSIGGDADGGGVFDAVTTVERLNVTAWPEGEWTEIDPLPVAVTALGGGACTDGFTGADIHSLGGLTGSSILDVHFTTARPGEHCSDLDTDVPWLSLDTGEGSITADSAGAVGVTVDTSDLDEGDYQAEIRVATSDSEAPRITIPVSLTVAEEPPPTTTPPTMIAPPTTEPPPPTEPPPTSVPGAEQGQRFEDVPTDHLFYGDIDWLAEEGITYGCHPPDNTLFCPDDSVTRGQMAAFLNRALELPDTDGDHFDDDETSVFEDDINRLAESGITYGCNPPDNTEFCANATVLRQEMASFLVRGYDLEPASGDRFTDDDGSVHEADIDALAQSGVTLGCNPPGNTMFCPTDDVIRAQMAAFLHRANRLIDP